MSSTPVFDAVARRRDRSSCAGATPAVLPARAPSERTDTSAGATRLDAPAALVVRPTTHSPAPTSPSDAPAARADATRTSDEGVPADLVEVIDQIPASLRASLASEHVVPREQLPLVEAVVDAVTRAVVDAVAVEVDRIVASGVVRV